MKDYGYQSRQQLIHKPLPVPVVDYVPACQFNVDVLREHMQIYQELVREETQRGSAVLSTA